MSVSSNTGGKAQDSVSSSSRVLSQHPVRPVIPLLLFLLFLLMLFFFSLGSAQQDTQGTMGMQEEIEEIEKIDYTNPEAVNRLSPQQIADAIATGRVTDATIITESLLMDALLLRPDIAASAAISDERFASSLSTQPAAVTVALIVELDRRIVRSGNIGLVNPSPPLLQRWLQESYTIHAEEGVQLASYANDKLHTKGEGAVSFVLRDFPRATLKQDGCLLTAEGAELCGGDIYRGRDYLNQPIIEPTRAKALSVRIQLDAFTGNEEILLNGAGTVYWKGQVIAAEKIEGVVSSFGIREGGIFISGRGTISDSAGNLRYRFFGKGGTQGNMELFDNHVVLFPESALTQYENGRPLLTISISAEEQLTYFFSRGGCLSVRGNCIEIAEKKAIATAQSADIFLKSHEEGALNHVSIRAAGAAGHTVILAEGEKGAVIFTPAGPQVIGDMGGSLINWEQQLARRNGKSERYVFGDGSLLHCLETCKNIGQFHSQTAKDPHEIAQRAYWWAVRAAADPQYGSGWGAKGEFVYPFAGYNPLTEKMPTPLYMKERAGTCDIQIAYDCIGLVQAGYYHATGRNFYQFHDPLPLVDELKKRGFSQEYHTKQPISEQLRQHLEDKGIRVHAHESRDSYQRAMRSIPPGAAGFEGGYGCDKQGCFFSPTHSFVKGPELGTCEAHVYSNRIDCAENQLSSQNVLIASPPERVAVAERHAEGG